MAGQGFVNDDELYTSFDIEVQGVDEGLFQDLTPMEITLGESLHTPGLQTSIRVHSYLHKSTAASFEDLKGKNIDILVNKQVLSSFRLPTSLQTTPVIYRLDRRKLMNNNIEEFHIHACDESLLEDARSRVSKSWKCATPSDIVNYVLRSCAGVRQLEVETTTNTRDYIADNIHPFQVVNQQANFALGNDLDPSFVHFMTYKNGATHHFKSLASMTKASPIMKYSYYETGTVVGGMADPRVAMTYSFPCDFDLLSDILNGVDSNGNSIASAILFNPLMKSFSLLGEQVTGCGIGSSTVLDAISNMNSAKQQDMCPDWSNVFLLKRKARMSLLEREKTALRLVVPWNPILHAGEVIRFEIYNKEKDGIPLYGTGDYLIVNLVHTIKYGGYAVTTIDCVSRTVGTGRV